MILIEIAHDFERISQLNGNINDVMLSSDSFTQNKLIKLAACLKQRRLNVPVNIILRGEKWVFEELGELLSESSCTDVFIGAGSLNNDILKILNKRLNAENIVNVIRNLSGYVKVIVGLILFIPRVTEEQLDEQLSAIERILHIVLSYM